METFSTLLTICAGNSPETSDADDVFFDLHLNKRLSKQWRGWWLLCHCNEIIVAYRFCVIYLREDNDSNV